MRATGLLEIMGFGDVHTEDSGTAYIAPMEAVEGLRLAEVRRVLNLAENESGAAVGLQVSDDSAAHFSEISPVRASDLIVSG